jgi:hypothetical protein
LPIPTPTPRPTPLPTPTPEHGAAPEEDYGDKLKDEIAKRAYYCAYDDEDYERVDFRDIAQSRERSSILALRHFCIVK